MKFNSGFPKKAEHKRHGNVDWNIGKDKQLTATKFNIFNNINKIWQQKRLNKLWASIKHPM